MEDPDLQEYLKLAKELAVKAGEIASNYFSHSVDHVLKADGSPVSAADEEINAMLIKEVEAKFPDHRIIGEEAQGGNPKGTIAWVCDPIDGTKPYTWGVPVGIFSLAVVVDGQPELGLLYEPVTKRLVYATAGAGAWFEDLRQANPQPEGLKVSTKNKLKGAHGNISGYGQFASKAVGYDIHDQLTQKGEGARLLDISAVCYHGLMVSMGNWEFVVAGLKAPHDSAALAAIIPEAGGKVTDLQGNPQHYDRPVNGVIISNGVLHDQLVEIVNNAHTRN